MPELRAVRNWRATAIAQRTRVDWVSRARCRDRTKFGAIRAREVSRTSRAPSELSRYRMHTPSHPFGSHVRRPNSSAWGRTVGPQWLGRNAVNRLRQCSHWPFLPNARTRYDDQESDVDGSLAARLWPGHERRDRRPLARPQLRHRLRGRSGQLPGQRDFSANLSATVSAMRAELRHDRMSNRVRLRGPRSAHAFSARLRPH